MNDFLIWLLLLLFFFLYIFFRDEYYELNLNNILLFSMFKIKGILVFWIFILKVGMLMFFECNSLK